MVVHISFQLDDPNGGDEQLLTALRNSFHQFLSLILIRDNISEHIGGSLMEQCHLRGVKGAFICPYTSQQDQAENYLGRITTMASYAMVHAGVPLFFWK